MYPLRVSTSRLLLQHGSAYSPGPDPSRRTQLRVQAAVARCAHTDVHTDNLTSVGIQKPNFSCSGQPAMAEGGGVIVSGWLLKKKKEDKKHRVKQVSEGVCLR